MSAKSRLNHLAPFGFALEQLGQRAMPDEVAERRKWIRILTDNRNPLSKSTLEKLTND